MVDWEIRGRELANCNCSYACPCQFNAPPTDGTCQAAVGFEIDQGRYGDVRLDGLRAAGTYKWPGAVHEGNGEMQLVIDERATPEQRDALQKIMTGQDTNEMATMWWVYSAMCPTRHETLFKPIEISVDVEGRRGRVVVKDVFEVNAEPIKNPVTGADHRVRIDLPHGFEYAIAEIGSATTRSQGIVKLDRIRDSYAQFAELHLNNEGVVRAAA